jgi:hypothetical protein
MTIMSELLLNEMATPARRQIHIFGGSTESASGENPASGQIARRMAELCQVYWTGLDTNLHLTKDADPDSSIESDDELEEAAREVAASHITKLVFWTPDSVRADNISQVFRKLPIAGMAPRKDIFLSSVSTTRGKTGQEQYLKALDFVKSNSANLSLAYDYASDNSMVVAPEETNYDESTDFEITLNGLMEIAYLRSQLSFTRSTVVDGQPVDWNGGLVYPTLKEVVNYCIDHGAYKPFLGVTAGHFAAKVGDNRFLTSRRKTNFNNLESTGLVEVVTDGPDRVVAMGAKPSVGGQSQRIVFAEHPERDCIVHFHCPPRPDSNVPVVSQREYECGSHECGQNTSSGLAIVEDGIEAVYLDKHGPNVVFHHDEDPKKIIEYLDGNFDMSQKTGGYRLA